MWKKLFEGADLLSLPVLAMLLFMVIFAGMLAWVLSAKRTPRYERLSRLPLDDGETER